MGRWDSISRLVFIIHWESWSDDFLERSLDIRSQARCFSCSNCCLVQRMVWNRWSRNSISTNAERSLLVRRMAVAISSRRSKVFMQNSKLIYR
jgi:hypothetical protein